MALAARFSQLDTSLNDFLFATIGEEQSGMRLSVASALARRGFDPWTEAIRLAGLPRAKASEALAALIACTVQIVSPWSEQGSRYAKFVRYVQKQKRKVKTA